MPRPIPKPRPARKPKPRKCIGYAEHEGKCENIAGTPWTDFWCPRCDEIRRATITRQLEEIAASFGEARR
jgi:hypothetical protein